MDVNNLSKLNFLYNSLQKIGRLEFDINNMSPFHNTDIKSEIISKGFIELKHVFYDLINTEFKNVMFIFNEEVVENTKV